MTKTMIQGEIQEYNPIIIVCREKPRITMAGGLYILYCQPDSSRTVDLAMKTLSTMQGYSNFPKSECRTAIPDESKGRWVSLREPASLGASKSRITYVLIALFLGGLGIHNFYAKRFAIAVVQLLLGLVTFGLVSVPWAIYDMICVKEDGDGVAFT